MFSIYLPRVLSPLALSALMSASFAAPVFAQAASPASATLSSRVLYIEATGQVRMHNALISSIAATSMTVKTWGGEWTLNSASDTKLQRRSGAKADFSEFQVGDLVAVRGKVDESAQLTLVATMIRDLSLATDQGGYGGTVLNLSGNSFSLLTPQHGTQQVTVSPGAKIKVNGKDAAIIEVTNGMEARVRGLINRAQSTIAATAVEARFRRGYLAGAISGLTGSSLILTTSAGNSIQVAITADTKVTLNGSAPLAAGFLQTGLFARVSGIWNDAAQTALTADRIAASTSGPTLSPPLPALPTPATPTASSSAASSASIVR